MLDNSEFAGRQIAIERRKKIHPAERPSLTFEGTQVSSLCRFIKTNLHLNRFCNFMEVASIIDFGRRSGQMFDDYTSVLRELRAILKHDFLVVNENELDEDASLREQFGLDSIAFLELKALCEKRFEVSIADQDFSKSNFGSLRELAQLVVRLRLQRLDC